MFVYLRMYIAILAYLMMFVMKLLPRATRKNPNFAYITLENILTLHIAVRCNLQLTRFVSLEH